MSHAVYRSLMVTLGLSLGLASVSPGQEWTRFRGPNGTGISHATSIPTRWTDDDYNWQVSLPGIGHSAPVIWGDRIFLTGADEKTAERFAFCVSTVDGRVLWKRTFDSSLHHKHRLNSFASATPAADADYVYFVWSTPDEYTLLALDHQGRDVWRRDLGPFISQHSCGVSPIVYEDLVVLGGDQDGEMDGKPGGNSFLIAVDRKTGETRWRIDRSNAVVAYSTPCVYRPDDGQPELIFNSQAHGITSIDPKTGKVNWEVNGLFDKRSVASSLLASGLLIGSCGSGAGGNYLVAVHPGNSGNAKAGQVAYRIDKGAPYVPTPIALGDLLFLWSDKGVASCVRASSGEILWQERVGGNYYGSPICVADRLYAINTDGEVVVLAASETYQPLARISLGEFSHSTPSVARGTMYLRTASHLFSLGGNKAGD